MLPTRQLFRTSLSRLALGKLPQGRPSALRQRHLPSCVDPKTLRISRITKQSSESHHKLRPVIILMLGIMVSFHVICRPRSIIPPSQHHPWTIPPSTTVTPTLVHPAARAAQLGTHALQPLAAQDVTQVPVLHQQFGGSTWQVMNCSWLTKNLNG